MGNGTRKITQTYLFSEQNTQPAVSKPPKENSSLSWVVLETPRGFSTSDPAFVKMAKKILTIAREEGLNVKGLKIHDNIQMLASVDARRNLRLQEVFLLADSKTLRSLFRVIARKRRRGDTERVNKFIVDNPPGKNLNGIPKNLLKDCYGPVGSYYDLNVILDDIMRKYTGYIPDIFITWRRKSVGANSITWGTFRDLGKGGLIRINKVLDSPDVPRYVVESIVYHELLHCVVPAEANGGERNVHTSKFKKMLNSYPQIEEAEIWKKKFFNKVSKGISPKRRKRVRR